MTQLTLKDLEKTLEINNKKLKKGFHEDVQVLKKDLHEQLKINSKNLKDGIRDEIKVATRDIISHFNASQSTQNDRLDGLAKQFKEFKEEIHELKGSVSDIGDDVAKVKLAVVDLMGTDRHLHNLVNELNQQGIVIDKQKVFAR